MTFTGHAAKKRFGQHWLKDQSVLKRIIEASDLKPNDRILEIGPGRGALTKKLLTSSASLVHAIELDRDLVISLRRQFKHYKNFSLESGDVLSIPLNLPDGKPANKVVANIPYNITGKILERLLGRLSLPAESIYEKLVLLMQKEVADRILASPGQNCFSALSVRIQLLATCSKVCLVPPKCFQPPPKVESQVIVINPLHPKDRISQEIAPLVEILIKTAFSSRRKMLRNTLSSFSSISKLDFVANNVGISLNQRPQEISPSAWVMLANGLGQIKENQPSQLL